MISTAKQTSLIKALGQYDAMTYNFINKYNDLPGDSNKMAPAGNKDGAVFGYGWCFTNMAWDQCNEFISFWLHLQSTGDLQNSNYIAYDGAATFDGSLEDHIPKLNYGKDCYLAPFTYRTAWSSASGVDFGTGWSIFGGASGGTAYCMTALEALGIDSKLDDGKPTYGNVRFMGAYSGPTVAQEGSAGVVCMNNNANQYDVEGNWNPATGLPEATKSPEKLRCNLTIKVNWAND